MTRAVADLDNYRSLRNQYKYKIRASKSESFKTYCSTAKSPWDLVNKITSSYKTPCIPTLKKDCGTYTISDFDTCSYLLDKWFPDDDISSENEQHKQVRVFVQSFLDKGFTSPPPITNQELKIINTISPLKACSSDLIKAIVLKNLSPNNLDIVKNLFSLCLKLGLFPTVWKKGEGVILPKPDRDDIEHYKSYRGITILSVFGKWFEKIMLKRLMYTESRIPRFSAYQFGFIPGKSCEDAICDIVFTVEKAFIENKYVLIICLDIDGAFDCAWPISMLKSMIDKGIDSSYVHILKDYLSNRLIRLKINNSTAEKNLSRSAPQGGGLSPFLWNCDFDDMLGEYNISPNVFSNFVESYDLENKVQAFADDNQVIVVSESLLLCQLAGNNILSQMVEKSVVKKSSFSASKSNAVVFSKRLIPFEVEIKLGNDRVPVSSSKRLLGVTLDSKLNWYDHIDKQTANCKRLLFLLNRCCKLKWGLSREVLCHIWSGCIEHILLYCCAAWVRVLRNSNIVRKLESVQRLIALKIIKGFKTVSYEAALTLSGLPNVIGRIHERVLSYAVKHPNHYIHPVPNSHVEYTHMLSENYNIVLSKYEKFLSLPSSPPNLAKEPNVSTSSLPSYPLFQDNVINIYSDGSKTNSGTGCAFVIFHSFSAIEHGQITLGESNSVYQAELVAILNSLKCLFSLPVNACFSEINVFSDSISSLLSIKDCNTKSSIVREIQKLVKFFTVFTNLNFYWCKGHTGILGNEMADYFAKESTLNPSCTKQEPSLPLSHLKNVVKSKSKLSWLNRWRSSDNGRITYSFIPGSIPKHLLSKSFSHKITQVLTGHCKLNFYLNSIGKTLDPTCSCGKGIETVNHYLWNCENEELNRSDTIKRACFTQGIPYPPDNKLLVENPVLFQALSRFLSNSSRLNL